MLPYMAYMDPMGIQTYLRNHIQDHIIFIYFFKEKPKLQLRRQIIATSRANLI